MTELLIIVPVVWMLFLTYCVAKLYVRPPSGLDPDDVDLIKEFMDKVRKMAATESRKGRKPRG